MTKYSRIETKREAKYLPEETRQVEHYITLVRDEISLETLANIVAAGSVAITAAVCV